jgi:hypothetical protein
MRTLTTRDVAARIVRSRRVEIGGAPVNIYDYDRKYHYQQVVMDTLGLGRVSHVVQDASANKASHRVHLSMMLK